MSFGAGVCAGLMLVASTGWAQEPGEAVEEIVVTGSRLIDWDPDDIPHVSVVRRADNLVSSVRVECDTRDPARRLDELKTTLRNMAAQASRDGSVELGVGSDVVGRFDETQLDRIVVPDGKKPDVSYADLLIKTRVGPNDSFDAASARVRDFVRRTQKVGRTEIVLSNDYDLTLVDPNQYRPQIMKAIAQDARTATTALGEGYGVRLEGLENRVTWYQYGPLQLALFIPYTLEIMPRSGQ
jgi:hypothetical protein